MLTILIGAVLCLGPGIAVARLLWLRTSLPDPSFEYFVVAAMVTFSGSSRCSFSRRSS